MPKRNRKDKKEGRVIQDKFSEDRELPALQPQSKNQHIAIQALYDPSITLVILGGPAGTGKSYLSGSVAGDLYLQNKIQKVIVTRPYVQTGRTSGFKPGTILEKLYPYVRTILDPLKNRVGKGVFENNLKDGLTGNFQIQEVESIRGRSFDESSFLIIDEAQQTLPEEMEAIITRVGYDCKLIVCGDIRQKDISQKSGMEWLIDFTNRHNLKGVCHVDFGIEDCVRSGFVKDVLIGLDSDLSKGKGVKDFK